MSNTPEVYSKTHFTEIYNSYRNKIYNLSYKMTGNKEIAEDITQDTFLQCYKNIDEFRGESQIYTWLYTIAKNICLRHLKKQTKNSVTDLEQLIQNTSSPLPETIDELEKHNYIIQIKEGCLIGLLKCLSFNQRIAFILNILLKVSFQETAQIINKTESATRTLIHRARKNIKNFLCANCSLYDPGNSCKCENLINFSLKQGWIKKQETLSIDFPVQIASEINYLKKITSLYSSLPDHELPDSISKTILQTLKNKDLLIFSDKKVK